MNRNIKETDHLTTALVELNTTVTVINLSVTEKYQ